MNKAVDRKLPSAAAGKNAEDPGVPYLEEVALAVERWVKIKNCQTGCF